MAKYEKGSFIVTPNAQRLKGLPTHSQVVYVWLSFFSNQDGTCFPSRKTLAEYCGIKKIQTLDKYIKILVDKGFVKKEKRFKDSSQTSNLYFLPLVVDEDVQEKILGGYLKRHTGGTQKGIQNSIQLTQSNYISDSKESQPSKVDKKESKQDIPDKEILNKKWKTVRPKLIELFGNVDSVNVKNWYGNLTQLKALDQLLDSEGEAVVRRAIELLPEVLQEEFCPTVYTPYELLKKWPKLKQFLINRKTRKEPEKKTTTASMAEDLID